MSPTAPVHYIRASFQTSFFQWLGAGLTVRGGLSPEL